MSQISAVQKTIEDNIREMAGGGSVQIKAVLGKPDGTVKVKAQNVYVTLYNGYTLVIFNDKVPLVPYKKIVIGIDSHSRNPNLLQVLGFDKVYNDEVYPNLTNHKDSHRWFDYDAIEVYAEQIVPLLPRAAGGMVVRVNGGDYFCANVHCFLNNTNVDMSAEIPASGAEWVNAEIDTAGAITFNHGANKDSRELLLAGDKPATSSLKKLLFSAKMYEGLVDFIQTRTDTDIYDPRFAGIGSGGLAAAIDWTDILNVPAEFPPDLDITDNLYPRKFIKSADPTEEDDFYAGYENLDIWLNQSTGGVFILVDDSTDAAIWLSLGGGSTGAGGDIVFNVDGALAVVVDAALPYVVTKDMGIDAWYIFLVDQGSSSNTIVDVNLNGTSLFTGTPSDRPTLAWNDANGWAVSGTPDTVDFVEGDIISIDIDQIAPGAGRLVIVGRVVSAGGGGSFNLTIEEEDTAPSVSNVGKIVIGRGLELQDDTGGQVTLKAAANVDTPPASADAMDDEFNAGTLDGKWTSIISSGSSAIVDFTTSKLLLGHAAPANEAYRHCDIWQSLPGGDCIFRAKIAHEAMGNNFIGVGLGVRVASSNRALGVYSMFHSSYAYNVVLALDTTGETDNGEAAMGFHTSEVGYFEVEVNASNVIWRFSTSGDDDTYCQIYSMAIGAIGTIDEVGVVSHPYTQASRPALVSCDWFRRIS